MASDQNRIDYRRPFVVFVVVLVVGLVGYQVYLYWYPRHQVSLAMEAQRYLHIAVEEYFLDHLCYPAALNDKGKEIGQAGNVSAGFAPWTLLDAGKVPTRCFKRAKKMLYATDGVHRWILCYPGPDNDINTDMKYWVDEAEGSEVKYKEKYSGGFIEYDPTNGTVSRGDVLRTGP